MNIARRALDAAAILIVIGAMVVVLKQILPQRASAGPAATAATLSPEEFFQLINGGDWIGPRSASVVVLLYSDYACGFCAETHDNLNVLRARYPQHLAVVMKHFVKPSLQPIFKVPLAATCAGEQGEFASFNDAAFENGRACNTRTAGE